MGKRYTEVTIKISSDGSGWQTSPDCGDKYEDLGDLLVDIIQGTRGIKILSGAELIANSAELDEDFECFDITGNIQNEPPIVFAYLDIDDQLRYGGIEVFNNG
jgi:hypothetical protein